MANGMLVLSLACTLSLSEQCICSVRTMFSGESDAVLPVRELIN